MPIFYTVIVIVAFVFLLFVNELFRRYRLLSWFIFVALPIIFLPWGIGEHPEYTLFQWLKTYSVSFGIFLILICRFAYFGQKVWVLSLIWLALAINILEAVVLDITKGDLLNYLNAAAGIFLILTLPGPRSMRIDESKTWRDFLWNIPLVWIIGYSFWNWIFSYINFTPFILLHTAILTSALLIGSINNKLWLQTRAFILGIYIIIRLINESLLDPFVLHNVYHPIVSEILVGVSFSWNGSYFLYELKNFLMHKIIFIKTKK